MSEPVQHKLTGIRACTCNTNKNPATDWNPNTHYYSNTPEETSGLFFAKSLGVLELGMEHNTQLVKALGKEKNYWLALESVKTNGYDNGHVRVAPSFLTGSNTDTVSGIATSLIGGSKRVYPLGPPSLEAKTPTYESMVKLFDKVEVNKSNKKIFHISLVTGYENEDQRQAFSSDANKLSESLRTLYGKDALSAEIYDPQQKHDKSLVGFAKYLYEKTDSLPKESIVIVEIFTHGDKSPFMHRETPQSKLQVATIGTLSWGQGGEVNEWEFRQVINSLSQNLTVVVKGNQCLGGQFSKGELVFPQHLAPANKK